MTKIEQIHYCDFCGARVESKYIAIHNKHVVGTFAICTDKNEHGKNCGYLLDICQKCMNALDKQVLAVRNLEDLKTENKI